MVTGKKILFLFLKSQFLATARLVSEEHSPVAQARVGSKVVRPQPGSGSPSCRQHGVSRCSSPASCLLGPGVKPSACAQRHWEDRRARPVSASLSRSPSLSPGTKGTSWRCSCLQEIVGVEDLADG